VPAQVLMGVHYSLHMVIVQRAAEQEKADSMSHQSRVVMAAENRVVMFAESRVVMFAESRVVMAVYHIVEKADPAQKEAGYLVPTWENRVVMVDIQAAMLFVVPVVPVGGARVADQGHTWDTNAERELFQRHNVDKNAGNPGP